MLAPIPGGVSLPLESRHRSRQLIASAALIAGAAYLLWRWLFTLSIETLWLGLPLIAAETWALIAVIRSYSRRGVSRLDLCPTTCRVDAPRS